MNSSPLGKYAPVAALVVSIAIIVTDLLIHVLVSLGYATDPDPFVDQLTFGAFGVVLGQLGAHSEAVQVAAEKINGYGTTVDAVQARQTQILERLDQLDSKGV